jgi:hypothetical protein
MTFADRIVDHQACCEPELLRLRMLAYGGTGVVPARQVTAEVREAANAVIADAEAAARAALAGLAGTRGEPGAETFLWVRLARLADAADKAVSAARTGDHPARRRRLRRPAARHRRPAPNALSRSARDQGPGLWSHFFSELRLYGSGPGPTSIGA